VLKFEKKLAECVLVRSGTGFSMKFKGKKSGKKKSFFRKTARIANRWEEVETCPRRLRRCGEKWEKGKRKPPGERVARRAGRLPTDESAG